MDVKRALENAAQGLRDAAAPLQKQLAQDLNSPVFLEHLIDVSIDTEAKMNLVPPVRSISCVPGNLSRRKKQRSDPGVRDAMLQQVPPSPQSWDQPSTTVTSANKLNFQLMRPISDRVLPMY